MDRINRRTFLKYLSVLPCFAFLAPERVIGDSYAVPDTDDFHFGERSMVLDGNLGRTVFISESGSDSNDGSSMRPVQTISRATELMTTNGNGRIYIT